MYADIILPLPLANTYTYAIPTDFLEKLQVGMRVMVPVQRKIYTGIVYAIHQLKPEDYEVKEIYSVLDDYPIVRRPQLQFWEWISSYYQSFLGDVYKAALPSGLKLESETHIALNQDFDIELNALVNKEIAVVSILQKEKNPSIQEIEKQLGIKNALPLLKSMLEREIVFIDEKVIESYKPRREDFVRLTPQMHEEENLQNAFKSVERAKKQEELLLRFLDLQYRHSDRTLRESQRPQIAEALEASVSKKQLLSFAELNASILNGLVEKNILEIYKKEVGRLDMSVLETQKAKQLNYPQQRAYNEILQSFTQKQVTLLHGVTSGGKTEIYIHLIEETLKLGRQVLYLLPEIALTVQLTSRLKQVFGNKIGVYHSKFPDAERVEIWNNLLQNKGYEVIIGVRSSVFLPFRDLGLIIVDEEHESTYKQYDPAPRYHARNAAIVLANMHGGKVLLGTATPSIESYNNAIGGKYGLVELTERYESIKLPEIIAVDTKELRRKKQMKSLFSPLLLNKMTEVLKNNEQVILFQNRRGYASYIECPACAHVPHCKNCDVSLTVHKAFHSLTCHYCGYTENIPAKCPQCGSDQIDSRGFGTERIQDEIQELFPDARIGRLDLDTARTRNSYEKIIADFEEQKIDILVGTQMISKGLDFAHVSLVGILNADNLLNFPDFRAHERAFQLMAQVSGRAGRKNKQGTVILQTSDVEHPVIKQVIANDYKAMFSTQMHERELFNYPPYFRLISVMMKHRDLQILNKAANQMAYELRGVFGNRVLGPDNPPVTRVQNLFIKHILLKIEAQSSNEKAKELINQVSQHIRSLDLFKSLQINLDVDPM